MVEYEYRELPKLQGVKRVMVERLVLTEFDKEEAVKKVSQELSGADFGAVYFLINSNKQEIYIGETADIKNRIKQHCKNSPVKGFEFDKIILIWDGRPIQTSSFNDTTLRKTLEYECINGFKNFSKYEPVNTVSSPSTMSVYQKATINKFKEELLFLLYKLHLIDKLPEEIEKSEALTEGQIKKLLEKQQFKIQKIDGSQKVINCDKAKIFYRPGSLKALGWQVTMRDTFLKEMFSGEEGIYFLFSRTKPFLIPASFFKKHLANKKTGVTLDIFIKENSNELYCNEESIDISKYRII